MAQTHLSSLYEKHARIEANIQQEMQRPHPDDLVIQRLKKEKLQIKETLATM